MEVSEKKISKKKQSSITPVTKDEDNETIKNQSPIKQSFNQINTPSRKILIQIVTLIKLKKKKIIIQLKTKQDPQNYLQHPKH